MLVTVFEAMVREEYGALMFVLEWKFVIVDLVMYLLRINAEYVFLSM